MLMLKRFLALFVDISVSFILSVLVNFEIFDLFFKHDSIYTIILMAMYAILFEPIFKTTLGKWLFNIKVRDLHGQTPSFVILLQRNIVKAFMILTFWGFVVTLILFAMNKNIWYDKHLGLEVFSPDSKYSETQKKWRKYFKRD